VDLLTAARAALLARRVWKDADAEVATCAQEQGISKDEAWAGVHAAVLMKRDNIGRGLLDLADPLGWRAAAQAFKDAEGGSAS
jgi:hypothetical protein